MLYLVIAWRNIWRNPRRTILTLTSILSAVALAIFMRSQQEGSYEHMIHNTAGSFLGHIQVQLDGYWDEQSLDNSLSQSDSLLEVLSHVSNVKEVVPRLQVYALASGLRQARAGLVVAIDPGQEQFLSAPSDRLTKGRYFQDPEEESVLLAEELAGFLDLQVNDSLVIIGQGYQGASAVGKYLVKGLVRFPTPDLNRSLIYIPLAAGQELFGAYGQLSSYSLILNNPKQSQETALSIKEKLQHSTLVAMSWPEMAPELSQLILSDKVGGQIMIGILYMVVGFGIFGTILMMTVERKYEFGVMLGIGMNRWKLALIVFIEIILLASIGIVLGCLLIAPLLIYFHYNPIRLSGTMAEATIEMGMEPLIYYSNDFNLFVEQAQVIWILTAIIALYPVWTVSRLRIVSAMRS